MTVAARDRMRSLAEFYVDAIHLDSIRQHTRAIIGTSKPEASRYRIGLGPEPDDDAAPAAPAARSVRADVFIGVYPGRLPSDRHIAQEGLFLVPSRIDLEFEEWFRSMHPALQPPPAAAPCVRFRFPTDTHRLRVFVKQLVNMGITPERLFPGLEGLGGGLRFAWLDSAKDLTPDAERAED